MAKHSVKLAQLSKWLSAIVNELSRKQAVTGEEVFELAQRGDEIAREEVNNFMII